MEQNLASKAGIKFYSVATGKLRRYFSLANAVDLFRVPIGIVQAFFLLGRLNPRPDIIFSKGGFVGFPVVVAAWLRGIPVVIHESDALPGLTTKLSARFARKILLGYEAAAVELQKYEDKLEVIGNPVRVGIAKGSTLRARKLTGFKGDRPVLLVMGGSSGAEQINQIVKEELDALTAHFDVLHLTGHGKGRRSRKAQNPHYFAMPYAHDEMKDFYALASLALSRSGASALAELETLQLPALLYPLGLKVSRGDQLANAQAACTLHEIFILADKKKTAHSQLTLLPKRPKKIMENSVTGQIAAMLISQAQEKSSTK